MGHRKIRCIKKLFYVTSFCFISKFFLALLYVTLILFYIKIFTRFIWCRANETNFLNSTYYFSNISIPSSIYTNFILVGPYNKSSLTNVLWYPLIFPFQEYKRWGFFSPLINLYQFLLVESHNKSSLMNILWYLLTFPFQNYKKWGWDRIEN